MEYNGGAVVAMKGKRCVAIASDKRFGQQAMTVSMNFPKVFPVSSKIRVGLSGLATDVQTLYVGKFISMSILFLFTCACCVDFLKFDTKWICTS